MFRANYLYICEEAHASDAIAISNRDSQIFQLSLKKLRDPDHFDLQKWLRVRNPNANEYITEDEINDFDIEDGIQRAIAGIK